MLGARITPIIALAALASAGGRCDRAPTHDADPDPGPQAAKVADPHVQPGIDVVLAEHGGPLRGLRVGLITNRTGLTSSGESTIDALYASPDVKLVALFSPEHGIRGKARPGAAVASGHDPKTGTELWRWGTWNEGHREQWWRLVPSAVVGEGVVLVCAPKRAPAYAVKLGGSIYYAVKFNTGNLKIIAK